MSMTKEQRILLSRLLGKPTTFRELVEQRRPHRRTAFRAALDGLERIGWVEPLWVGKHYALTYQITERGKKAILAK